ncbi:hypothetical protein [Haloarcula sp. 1CSR25-25]|uniref:hypothetical protein n=1 Tax=Haloarcula sp. 1CSR25-25 TaxID=2862545 RepID=UPI002893B6E5|nr:hypothetical protein [Haloarcula sp. 1CSR25-25]MDT3434663.1 hypothetical protein [Haloarcula sp. 1CSR25-25]
MTSETDIPDEAYWVEVDGDGRTHPCGMHKWVNLKTVDLVHSISSEENAPKRWVLLTDGSHQAWVWGADLEEYGYSLQPDERVSDAELEAITLKQAAIQDESDVSVAEALALIEAGRPEQVHHALVALYYAAKADSDVPDEDVDKFQEVVRYQTGHIDTSHHPTLRRVLEDVNGLAE